MINRMRLTVGPVLFNWPAEVWSDFYARIADEAPVDKVVIGEAVCSKRSPFYEDLLPDAIERLRRGGKTVALASLGLVTTPRERRMTETLCGVDGMRVEVNDLTALRWATRPFEVGPLVNVYNEGTLEFLARKGAETICLPPELPFEAVSALGAVAGGANVGLEVWAYGRVPLALSGRCYHARLHKLSKDSCQFVCGQDDDGLEVDTLDGQSFLAINGVQTLSHNYCNLVEHVERLNAAGVGALRLSPHSGDFVEVARVFRARLEGAISGEEALSRLSGNAPGAQFSQGFLFGESGAQPMAAQAASGS